MRMGSELSHHAGEFDLQEFLCGAESSTSETVYSCIWNLTELAIKLLCCQFLSIMLSVSLLLCCQFLYYYAVSFSTIMLSVSLLLCCQFLHSQSMMRW